MSNKNNIFGFFDAGHGGGLDKILEKAIERPLFDVIPLQNIIQGRLVDGKTNN